MLLALAIYSPIKESKFIFASKDQVLLINLFQRITGLLAFTLLSIQILLGAYMEKLTDKLGGWVFKFHIFQGALIYLLIVVHPALYMFFLFKIKGVLDPFYIFSDLCILCSGNFEHLYNLGRISFWLLTVVVLAGKLRNEIFLRKYWRGLHALNYLAFYLLAIHSKILGRDIRTIPFKYIFVFAIILVSLTVLNRISSKIFKLPGFLYKD